MSFHLYFEMYGRRYYTFPPDSFTGVTWIKILVTVCEIRFSDDKLIWQHGGLKGPWTSTAAMLAYFLPASRPRSCVSSLALSCWLRWQSLKMFYMFLCHNGNISVGSDYYQAVFTSIYLLSWFVLCRNAHCQHLFLRFHSSSRTFFFLSALWNRLKPAAA